MHKVIFAQGRTQPVARPQVSVPLISRPVVQLSEGRDHSPGSENLMRRLHMRTIIHYFQPMLVNNLVCVCVCVCVGGGGGGGGGAKDFEIWGAVAPGSSVYGSVYH